MHHHWIFWHATPPPFRKSVRADKPDALLPTLLQCSLCSEFLCRPLFWGVFLHNYHRPFSPLLLPPLAPTFFPLQLLFQYLPTSFSAPPHLCLILSSLSCPFPILFYFSCISKTGPFPSLPAFLSSAATFCHHLSPFTALHAMIFPSPRFSPSLAAVPLLSQPVDDKASLCELWGGGRRYQRVIEKPWPPSLL